MTTIFFLFLCFYLANSFIFFFNKIKLSKDTIRQIKYNLGNRILNRIKNNIKDNYFNLSTIENKKLIKISPAGLNGFYLMGVCTYIKEHYNLDDYIFSGASAGAWNSLYMCYNGSVEEFKKSIFELSYQNITSVLEMQLIIKNNILCNFDANHFDFNKLYIGVTIFEKLRFYNTIFHTFENLEDAINCCIASSHIPLITGGFFNIYKSFYTFDGGFSLNPYIKKNESLFITQSMWNSSMDSGFDLNSFNISDFNFTQKFIDGYYDTMFNKHKLDNIFL